MTRHVTSQVRGGSSIRPAAIERLEIEDGVRVATICCPYCHQPHQHVVPIDVLPHAPLLRMAKCDARRGNYNLILPTEEAP